MGKHTNYEFPSAFLNEIERPLRRDPIEKMQLRWSRRSRVHAFVRRIATLALLVLLGMLVWKAIAPIVSAAPAPEPAIARVNGEEVSLTTLCARYRSDHLMTGLKMEGETAKLCGF